MQIWSLVLPEKISCKLKFRVLNFRPNAKLDGGCPLKNRIRLIPQRMILQLHLTFKKQFSGCFKSFSIIRYKELMGSGIGV